VIVARLAEIVNRCARGLVALVYLFTLASVPAQAQHVLPVLGTAPLLGRMSTTTQLQERVSERRAMFETASADLGLTSAETQELEAKIAAGRVRWVRVPRHLDEMTWAWDGSVYMYRDVVIPADEYGWEIDISEGTNVHAVFIPAACGNLSLVERTREISYSPPPVVCPSGMMGTPPNCYTPQCPAGMMGTPPNCYSPQCPPGTTGTPPNCYAPQPPPAPPVPQASPPPALTTVVVRNEVRENLDWWLIPLTLVGFFFGGHYCHCGPPPPPPPPVKCPPVDP
jgi:hypothetical protein